MPLWLLLEKRRHLVLEILIEKKSGAETGGYICPGPLSLGIILCKRQALGIF
jgi:hypothetical protein